MLWVHDCGFHCLWVIFLSLFSLQCMTAGVLGHSQAFLKVIPKVYDNSYGKDYWGHDCDIFGGRCDHQFFFCLDEYSTWVRRHFVLVPFFFCFRLLLLHPIFPPPPPPHLFFLLPLLFLLLLFLLLIIMASLSNTAPNRGRCRTFTVTV